MSGQEGGGGGGGRKRKGRKRKKKLTAAEEAELPAAEARRRRRQRELQRVARAAQAQGETYVRAVHGVRAKEAKERAGKVKRLSRGEEGLQDLPEVVVMPISWRSNEEETRRVNAEAARLHGLLEANGLRARLDGSHKHTPGKKMRYWEDLGVTVRVEIGMRDLRAGKVTVARVTTPGAVADKKAVKADGAKVVAKIRKLLGKPEGEVVVPDGPEPPTEAGPAPTGPEPGPEDPARPPEPEPRRGGDDLDTGLAFEGEDADAAGEPEPGTRKKRKKKGPQEPKTVTF